MVKVDKVKLRHSLLNESRINIASELREKPQNISDLAKKLQIDRSTICYHLNVLEDVGILESKYVILEAPSSKGRAGRVYSINADKLREAVKSVYEITDEIKFGPD